MTLNGLMHFNPPKKERVNYSRSTSCTHQATCLICAWVILLVLPTLTSIRSFYRKGLRPLAFSEPRILIESQSPRPSK